MARKQRTSHATLYHRAVTDAIPNSFAVAQFIVDVMPRLRIWTDRVHADPHSVDAEAFLADYIAIERQADTYWGRGIRNPRERDVRSREEVPRSPPRLSDASLIAEWGANVLLPSLKESSRLQPLCSRLSAVAARWNVSERAEHATIIPQNAIQVTDWLRALESGIDDLRIASPGDPFITETDRFLDRLMTPVELGVDWMTTNLPVRLCTAMQGTAALLLSLCRNPNVTWSRREIATREAAIRVVRWGERVWACEGAFATERVPAAVRAAEADLCLGILHRKAADQHLARTVQWAVRVWALPEAEEHLALRGSVAAHAAMACERIASARSKGWDANSIRNVVTWGRRALLADGVSTFNTLSAIIVVCWAHFIDRDQSRLASKPCGVFSADSLAPCYERLISINANARDPLWMTASNSVASLFVTSLDASRALRATFEATIDVLQELDQCTWPLRAIAEADAVGVRTALLDLRADLVGQIIVHGQLDPTVNLIEATALYAALRSQISWKKIDMLQRASALTSYLAILAGTEVARVFFGHTTGRSRSWFGNAVRLLSGATTGGVHDPHTDGDIGPRIVAVLHSWRDIANTTPESRAFAARGLWLVAGYLAGLLVEADTVQFPIVLDLGLAMSDRCGDSEFLSGLGWWLPQALERGISTPDWFTSRMGLLNRLDASAREQRSIHAQHEGLVIRIALGTALARNAWKSLDQERAIDEAWRLLSAIWAELSLLRPGDERLGAMLMLRNFLTELATLHVEGFEQDELSAWDLAARVAFLMNFNDLVACIQEAQPRRGETGAAIDLGAVKEALRATVADRNRVLVFFLDTGYDVVRISLNHAGVRIDSLDRGHLFQLYHAYYVLRGAFDAAIGVADIAWRDDRDLEVCAMDLGTGMFRGIDARHITAIPHGFLHDAAAVGGPRWCEVEGRRSSFDQVSSFGTLTGLAALSLCSGGPLRVVVVLAEEIELFREVVVPAIRASFGAACEIYVYSFARTQRRVGDTIVAVYRQSFTRSRFGGRDQPVTRRCVDADVCFWLTHGRRRVRDVSSGRSWGWTFSLADVNEDCLTEVPPEAFTQGRVRLPSMGTGWRTGGEVTPDGVEIALVPGALAISGACSGGRLDEALGESGVGLSRAFLANGARAVVVAAWSVWHTSLRDGTTGVGETLWCQLVRELASTAAGTSIATAVLQARLAAAARGTELDDRYHTQGQRFAEWGYLGVYGDGSAPLPFQAQRLRVDARSSSGR